MNWSSILEIIGKVIVATVVIAFIYDKLYSDQIDISSIKWPKNLFASLILVFLLMNVNWMLEAIRWKISIQVFEELSFWSSIKVVLGGLALNWIFPLTSGDAFIRLVTMKDKYQTASAMLANRFIMLTITLVFGFFSIWIYSNSQYKINSTTILLILIAVLMALVFRKNFSKFFYYFQQLTKKEAAIILLISIIRYIVFVFQFFILLHLFLPNVSSIELVAGIGWIFFFRSIVPSFFGGIGVRETSGIIFFSEFVQDLNLVVTPIFLVWLINHTVPSIVGLISLWRTNINVSSTQRSLS